VVWDLKALTVEAQQYRTISAFAKGNKAAYSAALRQGLVDQVCGHMKRGKRANGHWLNKVNTAQEALKYRNKAEFQANARGAYGAALKNGWLDDICAHMEQTNAPRGYWHSKENCRIEALKYRSRSEFGKRSSGAAHAAAEHGWFEEICSHMPTPQNQPAGYWSKDRCHEEAIKYQRTSDFQKKSNGAYDIARNSGWLEEITSHMARPYRPRKPR
jgi:hypothetical protein